MTKTTVARTYMSNEKHFLHWVDVMHILTKLYTNTIKKITLHFYDRKMKGKGKLKKCFVFEFFDSMIAFSIFYTQFSFSFFAIIITLYALNTFRFKEKSKNSNTIC